MSIQENSSKIKINSNPLIRWIFLFSGILLTGVGILGMFLPLLPTTVFFLLAAWCYARSSEKFYNWLHKNKYFGKYFSDYSVRKGMSINSKIFALIILWVGILISIVFVTELISVRILLLIIAAGVTWHILAIKTLK